VISIGTLIVSAGFSSGLIQKKELESGDVAFVFTVQMAFGIGLAILVAIGAPLLAVTVSNPQVTPVLRVMAVMLVSESFAQVPTRFHIRLVNRGALSALPTTPSSW
jgi:O-antigen/teichoic acid export membrane protein